jgi:hypothetical protein
MIRPQNIGVRCVEKMPPEKSESRIPATVRQMLAAGIWRASGEMENFLTEAHAFAKPARGRRGQKKAAITAAWIISLRQ